MSQFNIVASFSSISAQHNPPFEITPKGFEQCPESQHRLTSVLAELSITNGVQIVENARGADRQLWERVHSSGLVAELEDLSARATKLGGYYFPYPKAFLGDCPADACRFLIENGGESQFVADIAAPVGPETWQACLANAHLILDGVRMLERRETPLVLALTRPPGHHSGRNFFGSFCYLNSAALAGSLLGEHTKKIAILDVDYHHGNGTQDIFLNSPNVRCASVHANQDGLNSWYPFTGQHDTTGPFGSIINVPLPPRTTEREWLEAIDRALVEAVQTDVGYLVLALGFDSFVQDPYSDFQVGIDGYKELGARVSKLGIPTLATFEGGYAVAELGVLAREFVKGFRGTA